MILYAFKCKNCNEELQIEDFSVKIENGELVRICRFCKNKVKIEEVK
jgi:transcription elongation factor Elf1